MVMTKKNLSWEDMRSSMTIEGDIESPEMFFEPPPLRKRHSFGSTDSLADAYADEEEISSVQKEDAVAVDASFAPTTPFVEGDIGDAEIWF